MADVHARDEFAAVVLGHMNPAIHHPAWYQMSGILTPEEASAALAPSAQPFVMSQGPMPLAKFVFNEISITCQSMRWQIEAPFSRAARCLEILAKTFDVLGETPVTAFGNNFHWHRELAGKEVAQVLGRLLAKTGLVGESSQLQVMSTKNGNMTTTVAPSPKGPSICHVHVLVHHSIDAMVPSEHPAHFDLGPLVVKAEIEDRVAAENSLESFLKAVSSQG